MTTGVVWLTAARSDHTSVIGELVADRGDPVVRIHGRAVERADPGAAITDWTDDPERLAAGDPTALNGVRDRISADLEAEPDGWLLVTEPQWLDPTSADVVARVLGRTSRDAVVVGVPGPRSGPVAAAASTLGTSVSREVVDDRQLDEDLGGFEDDSVALASVVSQRTGGVPFLVAALVGDLRSAVLEAPGPVLGEATEGVGPALRSAVGHVAARLAGGLRPALDHAAATRSRVPAELLDALAEEACIDTSGRLLPAVADAVLVTASAATRVQLVTELAATEAVDGRHAIDTVAALERLGAAPGDAPGLFCLAALAIAGTDPARALRWADDLGPALPPEHRLALLVSVGRLADATALATSLLDAPAPTTRALARGVEALSLQRSARFDDAAAAYAEADPDDVLGADLLRLARVPRALTGSAAGDATSGGARSAAARLAEGAAALRHDIDAAIDALAATETLVAHGDITLWPDTPTALAALALSAATQHDEAARVLRSPPTPTGAGLHHTRIRAVTGWVALRAGRWAEAGEVRDELEEQPLPVRERLLVAGLDVALAHRLGDQDTMAAALDTALHLVRRHPMDLGSLLPHSEVALLCVRLGMPTRGVSLLDQLGALAASIDESQPFHAVVSTTTALAGLLLEDEAMAAGAAQELAFATVPALRAAGPAIATIARGDVPDDASEVAWGLVEAGLVLEGSVVVGQAALNTTSRQAARPLLKTGREIRTRLPRGGADEAVGLGALSDREQQIATLVADGHTYKQIGADLFISAKTVEHHVAHIRTKLGVSTRAEMLAAIRAQRPT